MPSRSVLGGAALLPQFRRLGDSDEDELLFDAASEGLELLPAIAPLRRQLLLAQLIRQWDSARAGGTLSFAQAAALADSLAKVMDEVETQGCDLGQLKDLAPPELAAHWEGVTRFLDVLHKALAGHPGRRKQARIPPRDATRRCAPWPRG